MQQIDKYVWCFFLQNQSIMRQITKYVATENSACARKSSIPCSANIEQK